MSNAEFGSLTLLLFLLLASAHAFGHLFERLRQPRVIGEILAGVVLGPSLLGRLAPQFATSIAPRGGTTHFAVVEFVYWLGLLLLMFASGAETRGLFTRHERREVGWIGAVGTGLPFLLALGASRYLPLDPLMGKAGQRLPLVLVVSIAVAVTSIPVISRIFHDLKILHTRFARLILGVAVLEDIVLWAVLAVATAMAGGAALSRAKLFHHLAATLVYFAVGLTLAPALLRRLGRARWNFLANASPVGYLMVMLFAYSALAAVWDISLVFAAFLAGFAAAGERERFADALQAISRFSFAVFIPVYFALVGLKLDLEKTFSFWMLAAFLTAGCAVKLISVALGARIAGFRGLDVLNLSIATNARGGPGIVLASVAYDAGIINAAFYTTLVLMAVLTSQAAGAWLEYVLRRGWPLLSGSDAEEAAVVVEELPGAA